MKKGYSYLLFFIALLLLTISLLSCDQKRIIVEDLKCQYLSSPLSVDNKHPLLSWNLKSAQRGKSQSAYQILVASSPSLLKAGEADYWDSGIVNSNSTTQVRYATLYTHLSCVYLGQSEYI